LIPQAEHPINNVEIRDTDLFVHYLKDQGEILRIFDAQGKVRAEIGDGALPGTGRGTIRRAWWSTPSTVLFEYSDFLTPWGQYEYDLGSGKSRLLRSFGSFDASPYTMEQIEYPSKDGTKIPMFLVRRKDAKPGKQPVLMSAYGGFAVANTPGYRSSYATWLEL